MKITAKRTIIQSTAVQQAGKHFDIVLGIDIHWTKLPVPPVPLPLPHPFVGFVFDPMDYVHLSIPIPTILQRLLGLPPCLPMGATVYVQKRVRAGTTTSVFGFGARMKPKASGPMAAACMVGDVIPIKHITGGLPFYKIFLGDLEGPHDGEVYFGSESVSVDGCECGGSFPAQVLTCWGIPFGHQFFPPTWLGLYQHALSLYVPLSFGKPVMVGGTFVPHKYSLSDILMRFAAVVMMRFLGYVARKGLTRLNHALQAKFGKNLVSDNLCLFGFDPVNLVTGAMDFSWDDFELGGDHPLSMHCRWRSDVSYSGMTGNGVVCSYDRFIDPDFAEGVAAYNDPEECKALPLPIVEVGAPEEYYRGMKLWQCRPDARTWIVRKADVTTTYRAFNDGKGGTVYRAVRVDYTDGGFLNFSYDKDSGLLSKLEDHHGRTVVFGLDYERGLILSANLLREGRLETLAEYEYDERRNLIRVCDRFGKAIEFAYDDNNRVVRRRNRNGMTYTWDYDRQGRVVRTSGDGGVQEGRIEYKDGYNEVHYPGTGATEQYHFDDDGQVYLKVDAMGGETWYGYNDWHEPTLVGTPEGKVVGREYDGRGNLVRLTHADGGEETWEYDEDNRTTAHTGTDGLREEWAFDAQGRLAAYKGPDGATATYEYTGDGGRPSVVDYGDGGRLELRYGVLGLPASMTDERGRCERFTFDAYGRQTAQAHADGTRTEWRRDRLGRVVRYAAPGRRTLSIDYDAYDNPVEVRSGNAVWTMGYTPMGSLRRLVRRTAGMHTVSAQEYGYDAYDRLAWVENERGERYTFERDLNGEVIAERGFDGRERRYGRDMDGTVLVTHLPDGTTIHHQHDLAGRLTYSRYADGSWEAWEYDRAGRLCKASDPHGETVFERDALGRIVREIRDGHTIEHCYDSRSRLTHTLSDLGADIIHGYDDAGLPESVKAIMQGMPHPWEARLQHDRLGRETLRTMTGDVACAMQYDGVGRPSRQSVTHGGHSLYNRSYRWDDDFRLSHAHDAISGRGARYLYDDFGSLAEAEYGDGARQWRNPDIMGNVYDSADRTDRTYSRGGQLREDRRWRYHYDKQGNLVLKTKRKISPIAESPQGNRKSVFGLFANDGTSKENGREDGALTWQPGDYAYTWLPNGMLGSVTRPDGKTVTFKYDALGRRIEKTFNGRVHRYLWDGDVILHEWAYAETDSPQEIITEDGTITFDRSEPADNVITWVYDTDSYVPTAKIENGKTYSIVSDYIGRPVQAYDECGTVIWQADYDIYGNLRNLRGDREFIPFRQVGQYEDAQTGLYYNRFRYYDPNIGNYISQDPIGLAGNNPTMYGYVRDINVNFDLWGLFLSLPASSVKNPWKEGEIIRSIIVPEGGMEIDMAMAPGQTRPGGWGTIDKITDVDFVRNKLAVTPEFKPEISHVQRYRIPEGTRVQVGIAGPQEYKGIRYEGGGQQVELLNYEDRAKLEPIGKPRGLNCK